MLRAFFATLSVLLIAHSGRTDEPPKPATKPMWQRMLNGKNAADVSNLQIRIKERTVAGDYSAAITLSEELLDFRTKVQGADHWETVDQKWENDAFRKLTLLSAEKREGWNAAQSGAFEATRLEAQGQYARAQPLRQHFCRWCEEVFGEKHAYTARSYVNLGYNQNCLGNFANARSNYEKGLRLSRDIFGENHPDTAHAYNHLAAYLQAQGKYADATPLLRLSLRLRRDLHGEDHPDIATSYNNLASNLNALGKYDDALPLNQKSLEIKRRLYGEKHPETALGYYNTAGNLQAQGKYTEAQPLYQIAVDRCRELFGELHPDIARSYAGLAGNLSAQGRDVDAHPLHQRALELFRDLYGEGHPIIAESLSQLASTLLAQEKYADAQSLIQKSLDLRIKLFGDSHPDTAHSYSGLATILNARGKFADAQPLFQKALDLHRQSLGEKHEYTATSYYNLAMNLNAQGNYVDAQSHLLKALALYRESVGESHPSIARNYKHLALNLIALREFNEAQELLSRAVLSYEAARLMVAGRGLDRAIFGSKLSPYSLQATLHARSHAPAQAWAAAESDLARGLSDEATSSGATSLTEDERTLHAALTSRAAEIQPRILQLISMQTPQQTDTDELTQLQAERRKLDARLAKLAAKVSQRGIATLLQVQAGIPADGALILWIDISQGGVREHWGCVVRSAGLPALELLRSREDKDLDVDTNVLQLLQAALSSADRPVFAVEWAELARRSYAQRFYVLERHLAGVRRLFVVPVNRMAGVPVEVLTEKYTVSYIPSGSGLAVLREKSRPIGTSTLLAIGNPTFRPPTANAPAPSRLPFGGLLINQVVPDGNAARARLQPGDVLLNYAGADLTAVAQLAPLVAAHANDKTVQIKVWRESEENIATRDLAPGKLGVVLDRLPAPAAITEKRKTDAMVAKLRGSDWKELPGARVELDRLRNLFGDRATVLTGSDASEQKLYELRTSGKLKRYRYLHFATHGETNNAKSFESSLILAQDKLPDPTRHKEGEPFIDGKLTAREVLEDWDLDAELVTLSACESALGTPGGGDGLLGFAQAFLKAGARSVCLSLWKVDDTATALLMDRFYGNMITRKSPKAEALAEAKKWLREMSADEAAKLTAEMTDGVARGKGEKAQPKLPPVPQRGGSTEAKLFKPYAHPKYWAAFILIGDPN